MQIMDVGWWGHVNVSSSVVANVPSGGDADNEEAGVGGGETEGRWKISVSSFQFYCEPRTALSKKKSFWLPILQSKSDGQVLDDSTHCSCHPILEEVPHRCPLVPWGRVRTSQIYNQKNTLSTQVTGTLSVTLVWQTKGEGHLSVIAQRLADWFACFNYSEIVLLPITNTDMLFLTLFCPSPH